MELENKSNRLLPELPGGTITFLFTDIEGSTELLQRLRERYATILEDQRAILRAAFDKWGGREVDTQGDSFFVAFPSAMDAVRAAAGAQRDLTSHEWPEGVEVRVRMGLHTGEARLKDGGYVGMDVHRAARISSAGHGGQVLLSQSTCALIERDLSDGLQLRDLGEHRLKDLRRPVHLYQLVVEDLPADFPPLKSLNSMPNNLPIELTSFVGREEEIGEVKRLLSGSRLVTLAGPGGAGKTRLSMQVAADLVEDYKHGVWLVELAPVASTEYLVPSVASALHFSIDTYASNLDPKSQLLDFLGGRSMLVVMDNFEHLVEGADLLTEMLEHAPDLKLLVTSRERLNLREEWIYDVGGMSFPTNGDGRGVEDYSALALFTERAQQVDPDFGLTEKEFPHVVQICQQVEGMPLGIELAAGWVSILSCEEVAKEIEKNIDILATSMRGIPEEHRSLRAVFDHSWDLLTEKQKKGFRSLSIFQGGFSREAALEVADVDLLLLSDFVKKSLLRRTDQGRYEIHELLRQFAEEKISAVSHEKEAIQERHSRFYVRFLEERARDVPKPGMKALRSELQVDLGNLRAAIRWAVLQWDEEEARKALLNLYIFYQVRGWHEGADAFTHIVQLLQSHGAGMGADNPRRSVYLSALIHQTFFSSQLGDKSKVQDNKACLPILRDLDLEPELVTCIFNQGVFACYEGLYAEGVKHLQEAEKLIKDIHDDYLIISILAWLGWAYFEMGDYDQAGEKYEQAYQMSKERESVLGQAYTMSKLGTWADARQDYKQAKHYHQEAQQVFVEFGDPAGQGYALSRMSLSAWGLGEYEEAKQFAQDGLEQFQSINHRWGGATSYCRIGFAERGLGEYRQAERHFYEGLTRSKEHNIVATMIYALIGFGCLWASQGKEASAVELLTLALNHPITPGLYKDICNRELDRLRAQLPEDEFEAAEERGRSMDLESVVESIIRGRADD
jgi:predicted ATPase/class 3 adenylate cyclase